MKYLCRVRFPHETVSIWVGPKVFATYERLGWVKSGKVKVIVQKTDKEINKEDHA